MAKCFVSQAPQKILRKEKYVKLKMYQINKDNEDLEKRIINMYNFIINNGK